MILFLFFCHIFFSFIVSSVTSFSFLSSFPPLSPSIPLFSSIYLFIFSFLLSLFIPSAVLSSPPFRFLVSLFILSFHSLSSSVSLLHSIYLFILVIFYLFLPSAVLSSPPFPSLVFFLFHPFIRFSHPFIYIFFMLSLISSFPSKFFHLLSVSLFIFLFILPFTSNPFRSSLCAPVSSVSCLPSFYPSSLSTFSPLLALRSSRLSPVLLSPLLSALTGAKFGEREDPSL